MNFFRDFFNLNRREERACLLLSGLILLVIIVRVFIPEKKIPVEYYTLSGINDGSADNSDSAGCILQLVDSDSGSYELPASFGSDSRQGVTDLNLSDSVELVRLPGIGPVLASRIVKYRNLLGGFVSTSQLSEVYGISDSLYRMLLPRITADTSAVKKIYINIPGFDRSLRHPYISKYEADAITELRKSGCMFRSVDDLVNKKILSRGKATKLKAYFDFSEGF